MVILLSMIRYIIWTIYKYVWCKYCPILDCLETHKIQLWKPIKTYWFIRLLTFLLSKTISRSTFLFYFARMKIFTPDLDCFANESWLDDKKSFPGWQYLDLIGSFSVQMDHPPRCLDYYPLVVQLLLPSMFQVQFPNPLQFQKKNYNLKIIF